MQLQQFSIDYRKWFWIALVLLYLCSVIGLEKSHRLLNQSNAKPKPIPTRSLAFSRASSWLAVFTMSSPRLTMMLAFDLISSCDNFGFCFPSISENCFIIVVVVVVVVVSVLTASWAWIIFLVLLCLAMLIAFKMQRYSMNDAENRIVTLFRCCCYCLHSDQEIKMLGNYTVSDERLVIESSKFVWKGKLRVRRLCSWFVNCWNSLLDQQILSYDPSGPARPCRRKPK